MFVLPGQPPGFAVGDIPDPQFAKRFEYDAASVRRYGNKTQHFRLELFRRRIMRALDGMTHFHFLFYPERNIGHGLRSDVDALDLAVCPEHDAFAVRQPRHVAVDTVDRPDFLVVAIQPVVNRNDFA